MRFINNHIIEWINKLKDNKYNIIEKILQNNLNILKITYYILKKTTKTAFYKFSPNMVLY